MSLRKGRALLTLVMVGMLATSFWAMHALWLRGPAPAYSLAAELTRDGRLDARIYDDGWFSEQVSDRTRGAVSDIFSPSPPTLSVLLLPIALAPVALLPALWALANGAALLAAVVAPLATRERKVNTGDVVFAAIVAVMLLSPPLREDLERGQIYLFVLSLHTIVFWAVRRRRDAVGGIALGLLWALKTSGLPWWLLLLVWRRWRSVAWAAVTVGVGVLLTLRLSGVDLWRAYVTQALPKWMGSAVAAVPAYQTLNGFFQHLFRYHAESNPFPLWDAPMLATILTAVVSLGLLGITLVYARREPLPQMLAAGIVLSVCLTPLAEQYHYLALLAPLATAAALFAQLNAAARVLLVCSVVLVFAPLPFKDPQWWRGAWALFAYPRLVGALILWGLLIFTRSHAKSISDVA